MSKETNSILDTFTEQSLTFYLTIFSPFIVLGIYLIFSNFKWAFIGKGCLFKNFFFWKYIYIYTYVLFRGCLKERGIYKIIPKREGVCQRGMFKRTWTYIGENTVKHNETNEQLLFTWSI